MNGHTFAFVAAAIAAQCSIACGGSTRCGSGAMTPSTEPTTTAVASASATTTPTQTQGPAPGASAPDVAPAAPAAKSPPIDEAAVASATGGKPENVEGVVKVSFPRTDVPVE